MLNRMVLVVNCMLMDVFVGKENVLVKMGDLFVNMILNLIVVIVNVIFIIMVSEGF